MTSFLSVNAIPTPPIPSLNMTTMSVQAFRHPSMNSNVTTPSKRSTQKTGSVKRENPSRTAPVIQTNNASSALDEAPPAESDVDREPSDPEPEPSGDSAPPSKKKKGQRFYCTDFPPCNLSFTRSEHLARHIRKHTGERPFQCHCSRRFSRLDNLRQHAQTVHVNEEIPGDSLAATGTRFQRQIRTDRVRSQARSRSGTVSSQGAHSRGHSRNLSASSVMSATSAYNQPQEIRRRPPPLVMANDSGTRARLALEAVADPPTTPPAQAVFSPGQSTVSPYTPSNVFAASGGSPRVVSSIPADGFWETRTAYRRLSVPSGANPIPQHPAGLQSSYATRTTPTVYTSSAGGFASPSSSGYPRLREEAMPLTDAEMRRRTWHPSTYSGFSKPMSSGLSNYQTPDMVQPSRDASSLVDQPTRLPGIESFDKVVSQQRPVTPPVRRPSPMQIDSNTGPPRGYTFGGGFNYARPAIRPAPPAPGPGHRRGNISWDMSLHNNLTGLNLRDNSQRDAASWSQQAISEIQNVGVNSSATHHYRAPSGSFVPALEYRGNLSHGSSPAEGVQDRRGGAAARTSPEDSSSSDGVHTPSTVSIEYHPTIVRNSGCLEPHHPPVSPEVSQAGFVSLPQADSYLASAKRKPLPGHLQGSSNREPGIGRLEALVAVATSASKDASALLL